MEGILTQEEINKLINQSVATPEEKKLSENEIDILGEIGNISMGTAATTLFALLNHKVMITTPQVEVLSFDAFKESVEDRIVAISVDYTEGLVGQNVLMLSEHNVKIIANLMMGGDGNIDDQPIDDFHLSAIAEAMNQMIGSASTSMSQMFEKRVDISPPKAIQVLSVEEGLRDAVNLTEPLVKISFRLQILDNIIDSELMQVIPLAFAKELVGNLLEPNKVADEAVHKEQPIQVESVPEVAAQQISTPNIAQHTPEKKNTSGGGPQVQRAEFVKEPVEVKTPEFPNFEQVAANYNAENMDVLMDVALEVSVEIGKTRKKIKEILEFGPGTVIELDKLVGEPIDILVNGKNVAKGEVVVIDENFGVRITDIIKSENII